MSAFSNVLQFLYQSSFSPFWRHRRGEEAVAESDGGDSSGGGEVDKSSSNSGDKDDDDCVFGDYNDGNGVAESVIVGVGSIGEKPQITLEGWKKGEMMRKEADSTNNWRWSRLHWLGIIEAQE